MSELPPAGWHTDPDDPAQYRYWDGQTWTDDRSPRTPAVPNRATPATGSSPSGGISTKGILVLLALLAVIGTVIALAQGGGRSTTATDPCGTAMAAAAAEPDSTRADPLIRQTLSACTSVDEWLAALRRHPGAMGLNERAEIGDIEVQSACYGHEHRPVCRDALERGILKHTAD